jgi:heme/copper-type cytochrome/quinol oxidase subunit 1
VQSYRLAKALLLFGVALIAVGAAVIALAPTTQFGWFAYAPLSQSVFSPRLVLGTAQMWGAALGVVGLVACSWATGYLAGRRAERRA